MTNALPPFREHPFVRRLNADQAGRVQGCARTIDFADNAFIFREGDQADQLYLLQSGCVALEQHVPGSGAVAVESLCAGDILGLSWLFPAARWTLDARCLEPVQAYALGAACVRQQMQEDPALAHELLNYIVHALYQRLVRVRLQRLDVYKTDG